MRLSALISITLWLIISVAVGLAGFLNISKFETLLRDVVRDRYAMHADSVRQAVENGFDLGLALAQINLQDVMERTQGTTRQIAAIHVFDDGGRVLFLTGDLPPGLGQQVPASWRAGLTSNAPDLAENGMDGVYVRLENTFGQTKGGMALRYAAGSYLLPLNGAMVDLSASGGIVLLGALVLALVGSALAVRRLTRSFDRLNKAVAGMLAEPPHDTPLADDGLEQEFARFRTAAKPLITSRGSQP